MSGLEWAVGYWLLAFGLWLLVVERTVLFVTNDGIRVLANIV